MGNKRSKNVILTDTERLLISRATEQFAGLLGEVVASSFLTPREQRLVYETFEREGNGDRIFFWGGYVGASRRKAVFLPDWMLLSGCKEGLFSKEREEHLLSVLSEYGMEDVLCDFIFPVRLTGSGYEELNHRDWLGALMALGLKRSVVGDIASFDGYAVAFFEEVASDYVLLELKSAGRDRVKCERMAPDFHMLPRQDFEMISTTVASPRLDGVVKALLGISRDMALSLVLKGDCEINYFEEKEPDTLLCSGDILTVRKNGKFIIDRAEDETRKGRIRVLARKYL